MEIVIHPTSKASLTNAAEHGVQAIIITGHEGIGLISAAEYYASLLGATVQTVQPTDSKSEKIDTESGTVTVESMRRLYEQTRSTTIQPQVVVISQAERMSHGAQGAFLKLLEEPRSNLYFVLITHELQALLPTIRSRAQTITLLPIDDTQSRQILKENGITDPKSIAQILFIAGGKPEYLRRLATDTAYFEAQSAITRDARELLQGSLYEKLLLINRYKDNRALAIDLLAKAASILNMSIAKTADVRLVRQLDALLAANEQLKMNANVRLCLGRFVLY